MSRSSKKSPAGLPQTSETWYFAIRKLNTWITPEDEEPKRPFITLVMNFDQGMIRSFGLLEDPTPENAKKALYEAMTQPQEGFNFVPERPAQVFFEDRDLMKELVKDLNEVGIKAKYRPQKDIVDEMVEDLETHMRKGMPEIPGLLSQKGVNPKMVTNFFAAAADFYRAAPWVRLGNEDLIAIRVLPQKEHYYVSILGEGGVEYGLALYKTWQAVEQMYSVHDSPEEMIPPEGAHSLLFSEITEIPFEDLDDIEMYGWEVASEQAYPVPMVYGLADLVERPDRAELLWYEAALRAIPIFVQAHLETDPEGNILSIETTIPVATSAGRVDVQIEYPAGELPEVKWSSPVSDAQEFEDQIEVPFDRRAMEGQMARLTGGFSGDLQDPELEQAQELMYQAWEERNPAKRIALARKALNISEDCADAFVLLAEEEADTLARALDYYQKGVAAGERALGKKYFENYKGHFWGLLETRPYMRAMEGLARVLWRLGRKNESLQRYEELLNLNPGDNQGVRYVLVDSYLELNREEELHDLLNRYGSDWSAVWLYAKALMAFREDGESARANQFIGAAFQQNPYVPEYLLEKKRIPNRLPDYISMGDESEAVSYAADHLNYWRKTPGAIEWIEARVRAVSPMLDEKKSSSRKKKEVGKRIKEAGIQVGDSVKVKPGVIDPDLGIDLGGWQGRVLSIIEGVSGHVLVAVEWDSITLQNIPEQFIEQSEEDMVEWSEFNLLLEQVTLAEPRDDPEDWDRVYAELSKRYAWAHLGEQGRRIRNVIGDIGEDDELAALGAWEEHLRESLKFPFQGEVQDYEASGPLKYGDRVRVTGIEGVEDNLGVLVNVRYQGANYVLPLAEIEPVNERSPNYRQVDDYLTWFYDD